MVNAWGNGGPTSLVMSPSSSSLQPWSCITERATATMPGMESTRVPSKSNTMSFLRARSVGMRIPFVGNECEHSRAAPARGRVR